MSTPVLKHSGSSILNAIQEYKDKYASDPSLNREMRAYGNRNFESRIVDMNCPINDFVRASQAKAQSDSGDI